MKVNSVKMMLSVLVSVLALTACNGGTSDGMGTTSTSTVSNPAAEPVPADTPVVTPTETPTATPSPESSPSPSATPSPTVTPSPSPSVSPSPSPSPSPTPYSYTGSGTLADPYLISTCDDVQHIDDNPSAYYSVVSDIDFQYYGNFRPLAAFSGTLYGNSHQFYKMTIATTGSDTAAMFTQLNSSGTIVSLKLVNAHISSQSGYATGLVGNLLGMVSGGSVNGTITSPLGGNGFNTGTGNGIFVSRAAGSHVISVLENSILFNGNNIYTTLNY